MIRMKSPPAMSPTFPSLSLSPESAPRRVSVYTQPWSRVPRGSWLLPLNPLSAHPSWMLKQAPDCVEAPTPPPHSDPLLLHLLSSPLSRVVWSPARLNRQSDLHLHQHQTLHHGPCLPLLHPKSLMQFRKAGPWARSTGHKTEQQKYVGGTGCESSCTAFRITWRWWLKTYFVESWVHQACFQIETTWCRGYKDSHSVCDLIFNPNGSLNCSINFDSNQFYTWFSLIHVRTLIWFES